jgi:hypothetical protein
LITNFARGILFWKFFLSTIVIYLDLKKTDTGVYTCVASSETGETSWTAALKVEGEKLDKTIHNSPSKNNRYLALHVLIDKLRDIVGSSNGLLGDFQANTRARHIPRTSNQASGF